MFSLPFTWTLGKTNIKNYIYIGETQRLHFINFFLIKSKDCRMIKSLFFFAWVSPFTLLDGDPTHFPSLSTALSHWLLLPHGHWELEMTSDAKEDPQHDLLHHQTALAPALTTLSLGVQLASHLSILINHLVANRINIFLIGNPWSDTDWKQVPFKSRQTQGNSLRNASECIFCFFLFHHSFGIFKGLFLKWRTFLIGQMVQKF